MKICEGIAISIVIALVAGFLTGRMIDVPATSVDESNSKDKVITFTGKVESGFPGEGIAKTGSGKYSPDELLALLSEARKNSDIGLESAVLKEMAKSGGQRGFQELIKVGKREAAWKYLRAMISTDPSTAAKLAIATKPISGEEAKGRSQIMRWCILPLLKSDPETILLIDAGFEESRMEVYSYYPLEWTEQEFQRAAEVVSQIQNPYRKRNILSSFVEKWAAMNPEGALKWIRENIPVGSRTGSEFSIVEDWGRDDFRGASRWLGEKIRSDSISPELVARFIKNGGKEKPKLLAAWIRGQDPADLRKMSPSKWRISEELRELLGESYSWIGQPDKEDNAKSSIKKSYTQDWPPEV